MTTTIQPTAEFIQKNYKKTIELLEQFHLDDVKRLIETNSEEYATAPASADAKYYCAFPGGLCYHNLHVLQWLGRFSSAMSYEGFSLDKKSLLKVSVLHDFAKVGDPGKPLFLPVKEKWKFDKGIYFEYNPESQFFKVPQKSLYICQKNEVSLTEEEYLAILLVDGPLEEGNASYKYKEPKLATALSYAVYWSRMVSKEFKIIYP